MLHRRFTSPTSSAREADPIARAGIGGMAQGRQAMGHERTVGGSRRRAVVTPLHPVKLAVSRRALGGDDDEKRNRRERMLIWGLSLLSVLTLVGWLVWSGTAERRAIARMPVEQRQVIYEHTIESVRTMCADRSNDDIRQRCREQAEFLLAFPECQDECQKLVEPLLRHIPTR